jgi:hypothetical protein
MFENLTGTITFYYYLSKGKNMKNIKFPLKYEIIGRKSNIHNTNHWPEIKVFYDENKLIPEENDTFKSMIKYSIDESNFSDFDAKKFGNYRLFNVNYFTVKEINEENIDLIGGWDFSNREVENIHDKLYGESESLNESTKNEIDKNLRAINVLLSLVSWDGLCDIWAEYNPDDKEYEIRSKTTVRHFYNDEVPKELSSLEDSIKSMGIKVYIYAPWFVDNCDDEVKFMNESEEKQPKYLNILKDLVKPFKDEDGVCDIKVSYDDDDDMYSVYIVMGTEEMNDKFFYVPMIQNHISKLRINVRNTIKDYLPIDNLYVGSYGKPNCNWNPLNESSIKEKSLVKLIEKDGLYDFIVMAGLDFNQVRSLLKNIDNSKEILKQYIREFVIEHDGMSGENHGSLFALRLPLSNTKYVNDIMVQDRDQIAVEIIEYHIDEYGHREDKDQYLTSINNLTNDELLSILSWMMETVEGGYWF